MHLCHDYICISRYVFLLPRRRTKKNDGRGKKTGGEMVFSCVEEKSTEMRRMPGRAGGGVY